MAVFNFDDVCRWMDNWGFSKFDESDGYAAYSVETPKGRLDVHFGSNGCGIIVKPNGTSKKRCGLSDSQFAAWVRQTVRANS